MREEEFNKNLVLLIVLWMDRLNIEFSEDEFLRLYEKYKGGNYEN